MPSALSSSATVRWRSALNSLWYPDSIKNAPTAIRFRVIARSVHPTPTNRRSIMVHLRHDLKSHADRPGRDRKNQSAHSQIKIGEKRLDNGHHASTAEIRSSHGSPFTASAAY